VTARLSSSPFLLAESFNDPENARIIYLAAGALVFIAVALSVGTVLWWRSSKTEHPALGPLEVMGSRRWWRSDYNERVRRLSEARPEGAEAAAVDDPAPEPVDLQSLVRDAHDGYDDLLDDDARAAKQAAAEAAKVAEAASEGVEAVESPEPSPESPVAAGTPLPSAVTLADLTAAAHRVEPGVDDADAPDDGTPSGGSPIDPLLRGNGAGR